MAIRSDRLVVSLISDQWYFTFLDGHTKHNIRNRESGRKENKHGLELALSARRKKYVTLLCSSPCICWLSREIPTKPQWNADSSSHVILPQVQAAAFLDGQLPPTSVDWSILSPSANWLLSLQFWHLPSLVVFRSCGKSHVQALCVGFAPKQTKGSSDWHPHPKKRMPPIVSRTWTLLKKEKLEETVNNYMVSSN